MRKNMLISAVLATLPTFGAAQGYADKAQFEVLTGWRTAAGDHISALKITLAPGWITYWRAPGEAGIPPQFTFTSDSGITSITPHWPVPDVFDDAGLYSIGYYDSVVFPLTVDTGDVSGDIPISGEVTIGVCEEICIPVSFSFDTVLPQVGAPDAAITAALADAPLTRSEASVAHVICVIDPISDGLRMTTQIDVPPSGTSEFVVIEPSDPRIWVSQAEVMRDGNRLSATVDMVHPSGQPFAIDRSGVRITDLATDGQAIDLHGCSAG